MAAATSTPPAWEVVRLTHRVHHLGGQGAWHRWPQIAAGSGRTGTSKHVAGASPKLTSTATEGF